MKQTDKQTYKETNRHYEINGHLAVNQNVCCESIAVSSDIIGDHDVMQREVMFIVL